MPSWLAVLLTPVAAVLLWAAGAVFFDWVHWVLHAMLRSRSRLLRGLAWPHAVHHQFLGRDLKTRWHLQRRNIWCHLVPEYLTQLAFSGVALLLVPVPVVVLCALMQTAVFVGLLWFGGLDVNHRQVEVLDAYRPSWMALPAYHALHHVYPDAYFSAYGKLVDWIVAGGAMVRGRRFVLLGGEDGLGAALRRELEARGAEVTPPAAAPAWSELDVAVLCDPEADQQAALEALVAAVGDRLVPPEVWAVQLGQPNGLARHYYRDPRVIYRAISVQRDDLATPAVAGAARRIVARACRGLNFISTRTWWQSLVAFRQFRRSRAEPPADVRLVRSRAELAASGSALG